MTELVFRATLYKAGQDKRGWNRLRFDLVGEGPDCAFSVPVTEAVVRELAPSIYEEGAFVVKIERAQKAGE